MGGDQCSYDRLHRQPESDAIKPQRGQDQTQVMPGATHHRVQRIAQRSLERIAAQPTVHLHVPNGRLDGAAPLDHDLERLGYASHAGLLRCGPPAASPRLLLQCAFSSVSGWTGRWAVRSAGGSRGRRAAITRSPPMC